MMARDSEMGALRSVPRRRLLGPSLLRRRYLLRLAVVLLILVPLTLLVHATATERLPNSFPYSLLYRTHDDIWLPLRGHLWTATFPYTLVWLVPAAMFIGLLAVETLTPFGLRALHRRVLILAMRRGRFPFRQTPADPETIARRWADPMRDPAVARGGFACRVAQEIRQTMWSRLRLAAQSGTDVTVSDKVMLIRSSIWWLRLDPASPRAFVAALEVLAVDEGNDTDPVRQQVEAILRHLPKGQDSFEQLHHTFDVIAAPVADVGLHRVISDMVASVQRAAPRQGGDLPDAVSLAAQAIAMGVVGRRFRTTRTLEWFAQAAQARIAPPGGSDGDPSQTLLNAMDLCDYAFWAWLAETASPVPAKDQHDYFHDWADMADRAERFALEGRI